MLRKFLSIPLGPPRVVTRLLKQRACGHEENAVHICINLVPINIIQTLQHIIYCIIFGRVSKNLEKAVFDFFFTRNISGEILWWFGPVFPVL